MIKLMTRINAKACFRKYDMIPLLYRSGGLGLWWRTRMNTEYSVCSFSSPFVIESRCWNEGSKYSIEH